MVNYLFISPPVICLLACLSTATDGCRHAGLLLPAAVISPDVSEVITFSVDANGNNRTLQLNCSGTGDLIWYRGDTPPVALDGSLTTLPTNDSVLILSISPIVDNVDASRDGIPYYCVASNSLGSARSRTVIVKYAFFDGFEAENTATIVKLGKEVAITCGAQEAAPPPEYVWYKNNQIIDTTSAINKIRTLDEGATLVIYDLQMDDISAEYKCGVTNVRFFETVNSTRVFSFNQTDSFTNGFISYRPPKNVTVTMEQAVAGITIFYIGATNSERTTVTVEGDDGTLSRVFTETSTVQRLMDLYDDTLQITVSRVFFYIFVIEPIVVTAHPSNISSVFHRFSNESINFTCSASGTVTRLLWYHNTELMDNASLTLVFDRLTISDSGVYQCFWEESTNGTVEQDTWALTVQQPVQPNNFTITSSGGQFNGRTIVKTNSDVTLTVEFRADSLPIVTWFREPFDTGNETSLSNSSFYTIIDPVETEMENMFRTVLIITIVNSNTSGWYFVEVNDTRTQPSRSDGHFVSEQVPSQISFFSLSPHNCLLRGAVNQLQCVASGLPKPNVTFRKGQTNLPTLVRCPGDDNCTISISQISLGLVKTVVTANLTFLNPSKGDNGFYHCFVDDTVNKQIPVKYCTTPVIIVSSNNTEGMQGESVTLRCIVSSEPIESVQSSWYKDGVLISTRLPQIDISYDNGILEATFNPLTMNDTGSYTFRFNNTAIPATVETTINLNVTFNTPTAEPSESILIPIVSTVFILGFCAFLVLVVLIIILTYKVILKKRKKKLNEHIKDADLLETEQNIAYCSRATRENNDDNNYGIVYDTVHDYEKIHDVFIH